jgi:small subunit ribosomal protein S15
MMFSRGFNVLVCVINCANAFSPSARSSPAHITQIVEERQRYHARLSPVFVSEGEVNDVVDSPPEEDYIVNVGDLEDDDDDGTEDDGEPPAWYASQQRLDKLRVEHRRHEKDTGSPEFQVAGMTERISYLTKHLQQHPKDFSTRRGLVAMVNKRRRLLNFLFYEDEERYVAVIQSLGIRHKAPGVYDRDAKYSSYPKQKAVKKHLVKKK